MRREVMKVKDLCEYLKLGKSKIYKMVEDKKIPHVRLGSYSIRFIREEIDKWLEAKQIDKKPKNEKK